MIHLRTYILYKLRHYDPLNYQLIKNSKKLDYNLKQDFHEKIKILVKNRLIPQQYYIIKKQYLK